LDVLIVAGDRGRTEQLERVCGAYGNTQTTDNAAEACHRLGQAHALRAAVVCTCLQAGVALDVVREARRRFGSPSLLISTHNDHRVIHRAFELGASYLCTPVSDQELAVFIRRAFANTQTRETLYRKAARALAATVLLTPREAEIVELVIAGVRRRDITGAIGITESTLKWHIRSLLQKCDATNLGEVARLAIARLQVGA
jgi:DNA-binding NarL/FixJ family response regulator